LARSKTRNRKSLNQSKMKIFKSIIRFFGCFLFMYVFLSYIQNQWDFLKWDELDRLSHFLVSFILFGFVELNVFLKKQ